MTLMDQQEMIEALEYKRDLILGALQYSATVKFTDTLDLPKKLEKAGAAEIVPDCFFESDETFDVEKCARMLNDYEVEILSDFVANPETKAHFSVKGMELVKDSTIIKRYDAQFIHGFKWLIARGLLKTERQVGKGCSILVPLMPRCAKLAEVAKKLQQTDVDEWELWRGMPSLYRCNNIEI